MNLLSVEFFSLLWNIFEEKWTPAAAKSLTVQSFVSYRSCLHFFNIGDRQFPKHFLLCQYLVFALAVKCRQNFFFKFSSHPSPLFSLQIRIFPFNSKKRLILATLLIFISRYHIQSFKMQIPKGLRLKSCTHNFLDPRELQRTYWS